MSRIAETFDPATYNGSLGYKTGGTSKEAAHAVSGAASILREKVYAAICASGLHGMTADEAAAALGEDWRSIRPRVSELVKAQRIRTNGQRRRNDTGRAANVMVKA